MERLVKTGHNLYITVVVLRARIPGNARDPFAHHLPPSFVYFGGKQSRGYVERSGTQNGLETDD